MIKGSLSSPDTVVPIVDLTDRVVGTEPVSSVAKHVLPHRGVVLWCRYGTQVLCGPRDEFGDLDVPHGLVHIDESYEEAAKRVYSQLFEQTATNVREACRIAPSPENGYEFTRVFVLEIGMPEFRRVGSEAGFRLVDERELGEQITRDAPATYSLCEALASLSEKEPALAPLRAALDDVVQHWYLRPGKEQLRPSDSVHEVSRTHEETLLDEVAAHCAEEIPPWVAELLAVYENQMPQYPGHAGLEMGPLVLSYAEINKSLSRFAEYLADRAEPLRIVAKLRSGRGVADELQRRLIDLGVEVDRFDVRTNWYGYSTARLLSSLPDRLSPRLNVVCDTMISTGVTFGLISRELANRGGGPSISVGLVARRRPRISTPDETLAAVHVDGNDWLVGYGADALDADTGVELLRSVPFIACLKPLGKGCRTALEAGLRERFGFAVAKSQGS